MDNRRRQPDESLLWLAPHGRVLLHSAVFNCLSCCPLSYHHVLWTYQPLFKVVAIKGRENRIKLAYIVMGPY